MTSTFPCNESPATTPDTMTSARLPGFVYVGTSKAGSTWLFNLLAEHPQVHVAASKGLYFFDHHFDRGVDWYLSQFHPSRTESIVAEISHSYLYSADACRRIREMNPQVRLMICLREPVDRTRSAYLDGVKNGQWSGSLAEQAEQTPRIVRESCYADHVRTYLQVFPRDQIHIALFDDLRSDPKGFAEEIIRFLQIDPLRLTTRHLQKVMPAAAPRNPTVTRWAKAASKTFRRWGWMRLRGRVKRSRFVRNMLYRPIDRPNALAVDEATLASLRNQFADDVRQLETLTGLPLTKRWGY